MKQLDTSTNMIKTIRNRKGRMNNMKHAAYQTTDTSSNPDVGILSYGHAEYYTHHRNLQDDISTFDAAQKMFCGNENCSCTDINETAKTFLYYCELRSDYCDKGRSACGVNGTMCVDSLNTMYNITGEAEFELRWCMERSIPSSEKVCYFSSYVNATVQADLQMMQGDPVVCAIYFKDVMCQHCEAFSKEVEYCNQDGTCANITYSCKNFDCTNTEGGRYSHVVIKMIS
jgi:hypothetical protein